MDRMDKLLFNLHTIASVPSGRRISTAKEFITIEDEGPLQGVWRWKAADTRDKAACAINNEIRTVILLTKYIIESRYLSGEHVRSPESQERIAILRRVRTACASTIVGIDNICRTYAEDANVIAQLRPLVDEIISCVEDIEKLLSSLGEIVEPVHLHVPLGLTINLHKHTATIRK